MGQIGALSAESFCERMISEAKRVLYEENTKLHDEEIELRVLLRMNAEFIDWMLSKHGTEFKAWYEESNLEELPLG